MLDRKTAIKWGTFMVLFTEQCSRFPLRFWQQSFSAKHWPATVFPQTILPWRISCFHRGLLLNSSDVQNQLLIKCTWLHPCRMSLTLNALNVSCSNSSPIQFNRSIRQYDHSPQSLAQSSERNKIFPSLNLIITRLVLDGKCPTINCLALLGVCCWPTPISLPV